MNVNEIKLNSEQIDELTNLCSHYAPITDGYTALAIYDESVQNDNTGDNRWAHFCAVSNILRIGYISVNDLNSILLALQFEIIERLKHWRETKYHITLNLDELLK